ncbi:FxsA family protein [Paracoccus sp. PS-1]|uniref:FxsA family protein n=1 Tax=unclassified Paracoccus (in: a-proteobacteria) TaxID=2688777 RepID=UPI00048D4F45|nr:MULTISPECIES: FxsA family protein [unclassified Paracoccus (in: a-proteobacteria)]MDQ7261725.1 FxsA family protein [Paracoccus sp. PS1]RQP06226.1 MAG: FxsA family protein [Paracoccus sp. BP8]UFM65812.1 FxsA family protein [Paracoccus sp. MA]
MWLLLPFVILPIVEIALFIQVGGAIGALPVIALVLASAVAGVAVMRHQGARAALDVQRAMEDFRDPGRPMAHGALVMIAGLLMVVPGLFTSGLGLLLLIPAVRSLILRRMARGVRVTGTRFSYRQGYGAEADFGADPAGFRRPGWRDEGVIDGEYSVQDDPPAPVREGLTDQGDAPGDQPPRRGGSGWTRH